MIEFTIDASIIEHIKQTITPLISIANRLAIQHGFFILNKLRMNRSKKPEEIKIVQENNISSSIGRTSIMSKTKSLKVSFQTNN